MAVYDTVENGRTEFTRRTLLSLENSVDWKKHRLIVVNNNSCEDTTMLLQYVRSRWDDRMHVVNMPENVGTAEAWNIGAVERIAGEHVIKIDNDIVIPYCRDWVEQMETVIAKGIPYFDREGKVYKTKPIGQAGLKRTDCSEYTHNPSPFYRSQIYQLEHEPGEPWVIVEAQFHIMGSCVMHSSELLDKIGYMYQIGLYGFDDSFMSARARKAGFEVVMLPHILIEHIDPGTNAYQKEKLQLANNVWAAGRYQETLGQINEGKVYYNPWLEKEKGLCQIY